METNNTPLSAKVVLADILPAINVTNLANRYFCRSSGWLYHKINNQTVNGKPADLSPEERKQLQAALYDLSLRIRQAANRLDPQN